MRPQFVLKEAAELALRIPDALDRAIDALKGSMSNGAKELAGRLRDEVRSITRKAAARLAG